MRLVAAARLQPGFQPAPVVAPQIHAGAYLAAVQDLGSPAPPPPRCRSLYERGAATAADDTLARAYGVRLVPLFVKPPRRLPARAGRLRAGRPAA